MHNIEDVPDKVLEALRQRRGLDEDDDSQDSEIALMHSDEMFDEFCNWRGLIGWGPTLRRIMEDLKSTML